MNPLNVEDHIGLAKKIAWSYSVTSGIPFDELAGEAYLSLILAGKQYNPDKETEFSTFAYEVITTLLNKYLNRINKIKCNEIQMSCLEVRNPVQAEDDNAQEEVDVVKDVWTRNWFSYNDLSNVFEGIEKEIYILVCKKGYYKISERIKDPKQSIYAKLREMGYKHGEIRNAYKNIRNKLNGMAVCESF